MSSQDQITQDVAARVHLRHLDGLRGLAALAVLVYHVAVLLCVAPDPYKVYRLLFLSPYWGWTGHQAVGVFIVLSGYCLMLPVARTGRLPGGLRGYLVRRARRILPPYYAALGLCVMLSLAVPGLRAGLGLPVGALHALAPQSILAHVFLIQNWTRWAQTLDGPMWSVATEWQIYFLFGLVLLPVWRRLGPVTTVAVAAALGLGILEVMHRDFTWVCPQYLLLFTLGIVAAAASFGPDAARLVRLLRTPGMPWGLVTALLFLVAWGGGYRLTSPFNHVALADVLVGAATSSLLIMAVAVPRSRVVTSLSWPPLVTLGGFSYSLYLIHIPIMYTCQAVILSAQASRAFLILGLVLCIPLSLGVAYLFSLAFERPFMRAPQPTTGLRAVPAGTTSPKG